MVLLYNLIIQLYGVGTRLYGYFNRKAALRAKAQYAELPTSITQKGVIWFHAASVGEFEQALPLYEELKKSHPNDPFLFSFFSPSGYEFVRKAYPAFTIIYLPLDTPSRMRTLVSTLQPKMVIIIKYEFWYHFLRELKRASVPIFLVSGIFRKQQVLFIPVLGYFFKKMVASFTYLFVQDENSATLLKSIGIKQVSVHGDTRYDRVIQNKARPLNDQSLQIFLNNEKAFIAGSVWKEDKDIVLAMVKALPLSYRVIIAPHEKKDAAFWRNLFPENSVCYSAYKSDPARVLIMDTLGLLSRSYRHAGIAYIGGGFGKGIHNILEAAVYHIPVLFGPKYHKFREAVELSEQGLAFPVQFANEAVARVSSFLTKDATMQELPKKLEEFFRIRSNNSAGIAVLIEELTP